MNRRDIVKQLSILPLTGGLVATGTSLANPSIKKSIVKGNNIYESIGVDTVINCRGTFTIIGGSMELPEVVEAMEAASGHFAQYDELAHGIGQRLAALTGAEWGIVTAGCAAAMKHATMACVTGGNPEYLIRIPDLTGFEKTEVISPRSSRNAYDHAIRNVGVTMVDIESPEELRNAISSKTAMIYVNAGRRSATGQPLSLEVIAEIAKPHNIPILLDAAAEDLTIPNVHLARGATMVAYSGGKALCGPQCAGLLLGPKDLMLSAWQASSPHHGPGRDNKVGKEEMFGMLAAVEAWTTRDHEAEWNTWLEWLDTISQAVTSINGVTTKIQQPEGLSNRCPRLVISWNADQLHISGYDVAEEVARNKPRLAIGSHDEGNKASVNITPSQMRAGQEQVVANRLSGILSEKRKPISEELNAPSADLTGRWKVDIDFSSSQSSHTFFLEQDGNWIRGTHQGDFSAREMIGMIEGNDVKLRSDDRRRGDRITNIFFGKLSGNTITGSIHLGEYLTAEFTATRHPYEFMKKPVKVPGGPPLAT